jgi:hypothetical protein
VVNYLQKSSDTYVSPVKAYVFWWHTKNTFVNVYINFLISLLAYMGLFNPFRHNPSVRSQICGLVVIKRTDIEMTLKTRLFSLFSTLIFSGLFFFYLSSSFLLIILTFTLCVQTFCLSSV